MPIQRRSLMMALIACCALSGAACGGSGATSSGTATTSPVAPSAPVTPSIPSTRTHYVRTGAATAYADWLNQNWMLYHAGTGRLFVADPATNHLFVLDVASQQLIATIAVPGAFALDDSPDHSVLWVGTQVGDLYSVDPVAMQVIRRYPAASIGPSGFRTEAALALANGSLALFGGGPAGSGSLTVMGIWNPQTNALTSYVTNDGNASPPVYQACGEFNEFNSFARTPDRTLLVLADYDNPECIFNPTTGTMTQGGSDPLPEGYAAVSPSGTLAAVQAFNANLVSGIAILSLPSLTQVGFISSSGLQQFGGYVFSADSSTLYVTTLSSVLAFSTTSFQQTGWFSMINVVDVGNDPVPPLVLGSTGLLAMPMAQGVGFLDTATVQTGALGTQFSNGYLNPPTGPASGGTMVTLEEETTSTGIFAVTAGGIPATNVETSPQPTGETLAATMPAGAPGPVDVDVFDSDGSMQVLPLAFSYGPTVVEATPDATMALGSGTGILYGFGFGPATSSVIPPGLQVTVGGEVVALLAYNPTADSAGAPPYPLESVTYQIPTHTTAGTAAIQVATNSGTATAAAPMTYLPAMAQYSLAGAALVQGIYDPHRGVYYFADSNQVRVFSKAQSAWLSPIPIPGAQRLWGLALSPGGGELAITDAGTAKIYTLDPDQPTSIRSFAVNVSPLSTDSQPAGVAVSDAGMVYFATYNMEATGNFFKLNTQTGNITDYGINLGGTPFSRTLITSDDSKVFFNGQGEVWEVQTATDTTSWQLPGPISGKNSDLTLAGGQGPMEAANFLFDGNFNPQVPYGLDTIESTAVTNVYGVKVSPTGSLVFQPTTNSIDVIDGTNGSLRHRIALPFALSSAFDALVADGEDDILIAINSQGNGIAVIDLSSLEP